MAPTKSETREGREGRGAYHTAEIAHMACTRKKYSARKCEGRFAFDIVGIHAVLILAAADSLVPINSVRQGISLRERDMFDLEAFRLVIIGHRRFSGSVASVAWNPPERYTADKVERP